MKRMWHEYLRPIWMRRLSFGLLCGLLFALIAMGQTAAANITMRDATGTMVICTGQGAMTVFVDKDGQPVEAPQPCPDCLILGFVALLSEQPDVQIPAVLSRATRDVIVAQQMSRQVRQPQARAPPVLA